MDRYRPANLHPPAQNERSNAKAVVLLDLTALAEQLGVTSRFVCRLVSERRVPFLEIGKFVRFEPREIDKWVDERRQPAANSDRPYSSNASPII